MCLNKLYADLTVLTRTEFPLPQFFLAVDGVCRAWLAAYPTRLIAVGGYATPCSLDDVLPLAACLYPALLDTVAGRLTDSAILEARGKTEAEQAFLSLWRTAARGKRKRGDIW